MNVYKEFIKLIDDIITWCMSLFTKKKPTLPFIVSPTKKYSQRYENARNGVINTTVEPNSLKEAYVEAITPTFQVLNIKEVQLQTEANRRLRIQKELNEILSSIMKRISTTSATGKNEVSFRINNEQYVVDEVLQILKEHGYTVLYDSMAMNHVVRW